MALPLAPLRGSARRSLPTSPHRTEPGRRAARVAFQWIPGGDAGTLATLNAMRRAARTDATHPAVRQVVTDTGGDWRTVRRWLADRMRFRFDPPGVELVGTPLHHLQAIARDGFSSGDCDDLATLAACLGLAAGCRACYVVAGYGPGGLAGPYRHVWTEWRRGPRGLGQTGAWLDFDLLRRPDAPPVTRVMRVEV